MSWSHLWHRARRVGKTTAMVEACKRIGATLICANAQMAKAVAKEHGIKTASVGPPDRFLGTAEPLLFEPEAVAMIARTYELEVSRARARTEYFKEALRALLSEAE